jgi:hypothetical protein
MPVAIFSGRSGDSDDRDDQNPFSSRTFVASAIVIAAVAVCGIALVFLGGSDTPSGTSTPTPAADDTGPTGPTEPTTAPTQPPATADPTPVDPTREPTSPPIGRGPCRIAAGDQREVSTAPAGVTWRFESGMLIPTRRDIGPGTQDSNGVFGCFAHSPIGAVFAAMAVLAQVQDESSAARVIEARVADGPGRKLALAEARRLNATPGRAGAPVQFVGFKFVDYTPGRTIVSLAIQTDPDHVAGMPVTMRWLSGDWRMELRSDGSISGDPDVLASLDGYVRFRGG